MICGFPGSGYVRKLAVDNLIQELHAKHLSDIYSTSFPPRVMIRTNGMAELMKNSIFYSTTLTSDTNFLILTGESQPANGESEYLLAQEILDIAAKFNTQKIFTLAAYITGVFVDNPRIFCTATGSDIVKSFHEQNISTRTVAV